MYTIHLSSFSSFMETPSFFSSALYFSHSAIQRIKRGVAYVPCPADISLCLVFLQTHVHLQSFIYIPSSILLAGCQFTPSPSSLSSQPLLLPLQSLPLPFVSWSVNLGVPQRSIRYVTYQQQSINNKNTNNGGQEKK